MQNLRKALESARSDGVVVRGIAVINPGNPTGNILSEEQIRDIIQVGASLRSFFRIDFSSRSRGHFPISILNIVLYVIWAVSVADSGAFASFAAS